MAQPNPHSPAGADVEAEGWPRVLSYLGWMDSGMSSVILPKTVITPASQFYSTGLGKGHRLEWGVLGLRLIRKLNLPLQPEFLYLSNACINCLPGL